MIRKKIVLNEEEIPKQWYCILPDMPKPMPPFIETETRAPGAGIVPKIFPKEIIGQELSKERWIDIPDEVREIYSLWRPTPLFRATRLEKALKTRKKAKKVAAPSKAGKKAAAKKKRVSKAKPQMTSPEKVLQVMRKSRAGVNVATLKARTGLEDKKIRNVLFRLGKQGKVKRTGRGVYKIVS